MSNEANLYYMGKYYSFREAAKLPECTVSSSTLWKHLSKGKTLTEYFNELAAALNKIENKKERARKKKILARRRAQYQQEMDEAQAIIDNVKRIMSKPINPRATQAFYMTPFTIRKREQDPIKLT